MRFQKRKKIPENNSFNQIDMKNFDVEESEYQKIASIITSAESPVGIDAKKTHIIILHKLDEINQRMIRIEKMLEEKK